MCGFVGYVGEREIVSQQRLVHMRDTLSHRGPDDSGLYRSKRNAAIGLAHRRLSILDTRRVGRQPMHGPSGQTCIAYNGEFYSFESHRARLAGTGVHFQTLTDTEVILALYEEKGLSFLDDLDGMFAFALWDEREERLILVRDRLGIKPLFYAPGSDGSLVFGSEVKALLASGCIDSGIDVQAHFDYLALNYVPGPRTMLKGIQSLEPGHALIWSRVGLEKKQYWRQTFEAEIPRSAPPSFGAAQDQVLSQLHSSVQKRMIADVPLGMFLSGGIDSSAILMAMSEASTRPIKAFTIRFEQATYDESVHARCAAQAFGAEHHIETVDPDPEVFLPALIESMDQPYADSSAIPLWYLCRLARQHVTVALGGDGGDELFAGYRTHLAWKLGKIWRRLPAWLRETVIPKLIQRLPVSHSKVSFDLKAKAFVSAASRPAIAAHYGFKEFMSSEARLALLNGPDHLEPTVRLFESAVAHMDDPATLDAILASDFGVYLPDDILVKVDRMSMAHSLEARVPFLDHHFVEMAAGLPANYKLRGRETKAILKRSLSGRIPAHLLSRKKAGFNVPMASWLLGPLRPMMLDILSHSSIERIGLWDPRQVDRLIKEHTEHQRDHSRTLWALICFMLFNQRFRKGAAA